MMDLCVCGSLGLITSKYFKDGISEFNFFFCKRSFLEIIIRDETIITIYFQSFFSYFKRIFVMFNVFSGKFRTFWLYYALFPVHLMLISDY